VCLLLCRTVAGSFISQWRSGSCRLGGSTWLTPAAKNLQSNESNTGGGQLHSEAEVLCVGSTEAADDVKFHQRRTDFKDALI
jgi:hypothetical protein